MALQTESSFSSTSTSASSSSSSAATTNDNPDSGSFFTPTSSPPLILAFLAIGLLVTAIIAALGWRRAYFVARFRSDVGRRQMGRGQFQKAEMDIGSRPKLWDLRTTSRSSGSGSHVTGIDSAAGRGTNGMEMRSSGSGSGVGKFWSRLDADQEISWESIMQYYPHQLPGFPISSRKAGQSLYHSHIISQVKFITITDSTGSMRARMQ
ncbi:MAG: hypothetical protein NXY57DRAFT_489939 [Lentinula lateritia]|uniref:Uncharacterized protein n=1 Tax=Lentinula lateritia TaxID=40482 RepID=A0ABQ8V256_9AGAR|nr:MAG: hypothetical protein NXY57DRAFT_489939 [Lentinula lateritia]KAJ4470302.1 hypothetical protein C8R41DRAFT_619395 [Lentinula lateritia]